MWPLVPILGCASNDDRRIPPAWSRYRWRFRREAPSGEGVIAIRQRREVEIVERALLSVVEFGAQDPSVLVRGQSSQLSGTAEPYGRGDWIRTSDLFVPNEARYQAALRPEAREYAPLGGGAPPLNRSLGTIVSRVDGPSSCEGPRRRLRRPRSCGSPRLHRRSWVRRRRRFPPRRHWSRPWQPGPRSRCRSLRRLRYRCRGRAR